MPILKSLSIESFRGLQNLQLNDLGRINLLVGTNNSGKTSVLEALSIYSNPLNLREWWSTSNGRRHEDRSTRLSIIDSFQWLFPQEQSEKIANGFNSHLETGKISISSAGTFPISSLTATYEPVEELRVPRRRSQMSNEGDDSAELMNGIELSVEVEPNPSAEGREKQLELQVSHDDELGSENQQITFQLWDGEGIGFSRSKTLGVSVEVVTPVSHRIESYPFRLLSEARYQNFKTDVIDLLRSVDPDIRDIEILASSGSAAFRTQFSIYIQHAKLGLAPLDTFGDGIRRLLHIALKVVRVRGGLLLIDEIESTIHTEALQASYSWLTKWCKDMDVQMFATTHSLEAVDALLGATDSEDDLVLYRLEPDVNNTGVTKHNWRRLKTLREELGQEVRW